MFGFISVKEHERQCGNLHSHMEVVMNANRKYSSEIEELKRKLDLENKRATYWKLKFLEPDVEPNIFGSEKDIEYIKNKESVMK